MSILDAPPVARKRTQRPAPLAVIGIQCCRRDVVTEGGDADRVLANAPKAIHNFFVVPKVVE